MEFLGNLGIDIKLLIAQIINFGLLLWLLTKFLYKPIIKRIEKDETELKQAQIQKKELEQQKNTFVEQKKKELTEARQRTREIIKEAKSIAQKINKETREKAEKEALAFMYQSKEKLESLKPEIEKEILKRIQTRIGNSFGESFTSILSFSSQKEFQNILWGDFIKQVRRLTLKKIKMAGVAGIAKKGEKGEKKELLEKRFKEILSQKIGPIVLEYAHNLNAGQEEELTEIISEKIGLKLNITKTQNKNLINGFRFEIEGIIIESNLLNIINYATNFKK
ncbi:MAG TPA: hypothetical protein ENH26_03080 [Candidatus Wolfebacteria bacterium]|nr:hypothetical protein [Candidatus Wolfebacteria bacterium]